MNALSYIQSERVAKNIEHNQAYMKAAVNAPIFYSQGEADKFWSGAMKLAKMSQEDREKILSKSPKELAKAATGQATKGASVNTDEEVAAFAFAMDKAMGLVNKALDATLYADPIAKAALSKNLHVDGFKDESAATRMIDLGLRSEADGNFDLGWQQAFTIENAEDVEKIKLRNWGTMAQMLEYASSTADAKYQSFSGSDYGELGPRYFMSAVQYGTRSMRFSYVDANRLLAEIRREALRKIGQFAYRVIFDGAEVPTEKISTKFTGESKYSAFEIEVYNARATMNSARRTLIDNANGIERGSKRVRYNGNKLSFAESTTALLYTSHIHGEFLREVQYMNRGADNTNITLYGNVAVIPTIHAPLTGSWKVKALQHEARDEQGFMDEVSEGSTLDKAGGMLTLAGGYSTLAFFRRLTFLSSTEEIKEAIKVVGKQEMNAVMGEGQRRHIIFK